MINATLISDDIVAIKHPNDGVSIRAGKSFITLTRDEFALLVSFVDADEVYQR